MSARIRNLLFPVFALFLLTSVTLAAQEGGGAEPKKANKTALELFETTGFVGWLMVICSVTGTALSIEHIVNLRREKLAPASLAEDLKALIDEERYDEAVELAEEEGGYLSSLIASALQMRHAGYEEMIQGLEAAASEQAFKLNTKISYLSLIGNVAPLLGLLGTVTGMISSFQEIEKLKAPTPGDLAVGVYESLVNTTMGLFVAIIFLTAYFLFKNKVAKMTLSMNLQAVGMLRHLAPSKEAHAV